MRIVFERGFGHYLPRRVYELPDPIADIHIRARRARAVDDDQVVAGEPADGAQDPPKAATATTAPTPVKSTKGKGKRKK